MNYIKVFETLLKRYGEMNWWPAKNDYEMMVGAILTQNTTWKNVEKAILNFTDNLTPEFVENIEIAELSEIIRPSGYYNQKAIKLKEITKWFARYSYDINEARKLDGNFLRKELLNVKGVGQETADSILTYALQKPFFVVDTYTRRLFARIGVNVPKKYDDFRLKIQANIPKSLYIYNEYHALIVEHAKHHCKKKPICQDCPLEDICKKNID